MDRAEEASLKAYPVKKEWVGNQYGDYADINEDARRIFQEGYRQAEKDLSVEGVKIEEVARKWWNKGYLEGRKNAHIRARELGLPKAFDFHNPISFLTWEDIRDILRASEGISLSFPIMSVEYCKEVLRQIQELSSE